MAAPVLVSMPVGSVMVTGATDTAARAATPVPVRLTLAGVTVTPVPATVRVPVWLVADVGANCTLTVHDAPTASVFPQFGAPAGNVPVVTRVKAAAPDNV